MELNSVNVNIHHHEAIPGDSIWVYDIYSTLKIKIFDILDFFVQCIFDLFSHHISVCLKFLTSCILNNLLYNGEQVVQISPH